MCRWRRRWQWGPGPSHPQATTSATDTATAPVDIEQPAVQSQEASHNDAGASSSSSHGGLAGNTPAVALGSTHFNFPGMHYSRAASSRLSAVVRDCSLTCTMMTFVFSSLSVHVLHSPLHGSNGVQSLQWPQSCMAAELHLNVGKCLYIAHSANLCLRAPAGVKR